MSQHYFAATPIAGKPVTVILGYDEAPNYVFCMITVEGESVYCDLDDPEAMHCQDVNYYRNKLAELGVDVPESMFVEVKRDQARTVGGNRIMVHGVDPKPTP